jgi:hypothetical protein
MPVLLLAAALVVATGAIAAVASADARLGLLGLAAALVAAAFVSDPLPDPGVLAVRVSAALLAVAVLRAAPIAPREGATRDRSRGWSGSSGRGGRRSSSWSGDGSRLAWPTVAVLAGAGAAAGLALGARLQTLAAIAASGTGPGAGTDVGSELTSAAGLSLGLAGLLIAIAAGPALFGRLTLRGATAGLLLVEAAELTRLGLGARPSVAEEIVVALVLVVVAATGALVSGVGSLGGGPVEAADDAVAES